MTNLTLRAKEVFSKDLYATEATGVALETVERDHARCSLRLQPVHRNAMGGVMGGVMFTLADLAFAAAANSPCIDAGEPLSWVSTGSSIHYIAQPVGHLLVAETQYIKRTRSSCLFHINIHDDQDILVAVVTTTGRKVAQQHSPCL